MHAKAYAKEPYCCDFVFVSQSLTRRIHDLATNLDTQDSDHQPLLLDIDDR